MLKVKICLVSRSFIEVDRTLLILYCINIIIIALVFHLTKSYTVYSDLLLIASVSCICLTES